MAYSLPTSTCFEITLEDAVAHLRLSRPEAKNSMIAEFGRSCPPR